MIPEGNTSNQHIEIENFIEFLNDKDHKHWCIVQKPGMRGNAIARILASHKESWWDNDTMNLHTDDNITDPLQFSETQSSFIEGNHGIKMTYLAPHTNLRVDYFFVVDCNKDYAPFKKIMNKRSNHLDKYFFTITHPYKNLIGRYIHLYASKQNSSRLYVETNQVDDERVINVDISKLFSYDRVDFEDEYVKILNRFDFTPRFSSVRNFILQLLDRETNFEYHSPILDKRFTEIGWFGNYDSALIEVK